MTNEQKIVCSQQPKQKCAKRRRRASVLFFFFLLFPYRLRRRRRRPAAAAAPPAPLPPRRPPACRGKTSLLFPICLSRACLGTHSFFWRVRKWQCKKRRFFSPRRVRTVRTSTARPTRSHHPSLPLSDRAPPPAQNCPLLLPLLLLLLMLPLDAAVAAAGAARWRMPVAGQ